MRAVFVVALAVLALTTCALATEYHSEDVWGVWTKANSPHIILWDVRVPPESTLVIEPGCQVLFRGYFKFVVDNSATLLAVGTEDDPIIFNEENPGTYWHGIRFLGSNASILKYCRFQHGKAVGSGEDGLGGAVFCDHSSPLIQNCFFVGNEALGGGGGIHGYYSNPIITRCYFTGNIRSCIYLYQSYPGATITNNVFTSNFSEEGGAVYCSYSNSTISGNTFRSNTGSAVYLWETSVLLENNTFFRNSSVWQGGAILSQRSDPLIRNCILWENSAPYGPEIYADVNSNMTIDYSDIKGGWTGVGNIDVDPMFVNPEEGNLSLFWGSPCIDTGHPALWDPDASRSDIGAHFFNQSVTPSIELYPHDVPIVIPARGGKVEYDGWVYNLGAPMTVDVWTYLVLSDSQRYGPIKKFLNQVIEPAGRIGMNNIDNFLPSRAPAGKYTYIGYVGDFESTVLDSSFFSFTKQ